jgi:hypothetical protein
MDPDRYEANCQRCERTFEYGLFNRNYPYCVECKDVLDAEAIGRIDDGKVSWVEDRHDMPTPEPESEADRQRRYTTEDHRRAMDDYDRRNKP